MKKLFALLLAVLMCLSLAACSGGGETPAEPAPAEEPAAETSGETFEELLAAGIANGNKLTIYSTHSVTVSALEAFHNKYCPDVECEGTQVGDTEQVTQVAQEVKEGVLGADIIFIQDGARVLTDLVDEGYVYNWYNDEIKNLVGDDCEPLLVWDYCNKVVMYNNGSENTFNEGDIKNIWFATDPANKGAFWMKDPTTEGVNMNFLVNLTSEENAAKMAEAYKAYYGKDIVLDADCPNAGYQFIKMMYKNGVVAFQSSESGEISAFLDPYSSPSSIHSWIYSKPESHPAIVQVANADNPELAKAFLIWLYSEEGWYGDGQMTLNDGSVYKGMQGRYGDYSGNTANPTADGDMSVVEWKKILVQEDPEQAAEYRADVEDFIQLVK